MPSGAIRLRTRRTTLSRVLDPLPTSSAGIPSAEARSFRATMQPGSDSRAVNAASSPGGNATQRSPRCRRPSSSIDAGASGAGPAAQPFATDVELDRVRVGPDPVLEGVPGGGWLVAVVDEQQARPSLVRQTLALVRLFGPAHVDDLVVGLRVCAPRCS